MNLLLLANQIDPNTCYLDTIVDLIPQGPMRETLTVTGGPIKVFRQLNSHMFDTTAPPIALPL